MAETVKRVTIEAARALIEAPEDVGVIPYSVTPFPKSEGALCGILPKMADIRGVEASTGRSVSVVVRLPGILGTGIARARGREPLAREYITLRDSPTEISPAA